MSFQQPTDQGACLLLVDGNVDTRNLYARILRQSGHEVEVASSIAGAMELCRHQAFDLLVSETQLPDGDGGDLLRQMRHIHPTRGVAVSSRAFESDIAAGLDAGFDLYMVKPLTAQQLIDGVRRALRADCRPLPKANARTPAWEGRGAWAF